MDGITWCVVGFVLLAKGLMQVMNERPIAEAISLTEDEVKKILSQRKKKS